MDGSCQYGRECDGRARGTSIHVVQNVAQRREVDE
jgi:hypothetical protein